MIKPEQIPPEVVACVRRNLFCNAPDAEWIVAAALNAWPGMERQGFVMAWRTPRIILPLPTEASDE